MKPYGLMADLHAHLWDAFSTVGEDGVNSRVRGLCDEIERCAATTILAGGNLMFIAGDVFHVRGSVAPSVFNPVRKTLRSIKARGVQIQIIPGNHDLTGKDASEEIGSSVKMLSEEKILVIHEPVSGNAVMQIPWCSNMALFRERLNAYVDKCKRVGIETRELDLICHTGIEGAIGGMPHGHALDPAEAASWGFKRVFSGHYHNHVSFEDGKVFSIGAPMHHTWGDVGTKAGFLIVHPDTVQFFASHQPSFVVLTEDMLASESLMLEACDGNYVRAKLNSTARKDFDATKAKLLAMGAKAVIIEAIPESTVAEKRAGASTKSITSLRTSVIDYVNEQGMSAEVNAACLEVMTEAGV